jgi:hypothetical protein
LKSAQMEDRALVGGVMVYSRKDRVPIFQIKLKVRYGFALFRRFDVPDPLKGEVAEAYDAARDICFGMGLRMFDVAEILQYTKTVNVDTAAGDHDIPVFDHVMGRMDTMTITLSAGEMKG